MSNTVGSEVPGNELYGSCNGTAWHCCDDNKVGGNPFGVAQISKTRGVPSQGGTERGPRGQRQNFRSFTGTNWQQSGKNRETMWQNGGVFSNAAGGWMTCKCPNNNTTWQCQNVAGGTGNCCKQQGGGDANSEMCKQSGDRTISSGISKTRGVPSQGSLRYGPRGQRQNFRSFGGGTYSRFEGDSNGTIKTVSVGRLVMGYLAIGLTAFVVGYSLMKGKETAN